MNRNGNQLKRGAVKLGRFLSAARAFTLIEFVLVMALLATLMALAAPSLAGSMRQRALDQEAVRFLALTEHARNEAVSRGVPMVIWIDPETRRFGLESKPGHLLMEPRKLEFALAPEVHFELERRASVGRTMATIEFGPDGWLVWDSLDWVRLVDRRQSGMLIARGTNGWGYEIVKEHEQASQRR
jgi:type II secretion system protein H